MEKFNFSIDKSNKIDDSLENFPVIERILKKVDRPLVKFDDLEKEHQQAAQSEEKIKKISRYEEILRNYLKLYNIDAPIKKVADGFFQLDLAESDYQLDKLPAGYVYHGGAARAILERKLGINQEAKPRDIDLVFAGDDEDGELSQKLAQKYSPDDYDNGHGVQKIADDYFSTRDFTINEVLVLNDKILFTKQCLLDTVRGIIRFTDSQLQESYDEDRPYYIKPKLLAKALRFAAEKDYVLDNDEPYYFQEIGAFDMALHLDRALDTGYDVARRYLESLKQKQQIPERIEDIDDLLEYLSENTDFVFRCTKLADYQAEEEFLNDDSFDDYDALPLRQSMKR